MHWAARNGHAHVCRWLVEACELDADAATCDLTRPFHWAVWQQQRDVCEYLVDVAGCDLHSRNSYGCNALQWAAQVAEDDTCPVWQLLPPTLALFGRWRRTIRRCACGCSAVGWI